jgi:hypothetical protein
MTNITYFHTFTIGLVAMFVSLVLVICAELAQL